MTNIDFLSLSKSKTDPNIFGFCFCCVFSAWLDSGAVHEEGDFRRALAIVFSRRFGVTSGEHQITAPRCRERHPINHHDPWFFFVIENGAVSTVFLFVSSVFLRVLVFHQMFLLSHQEWILVHDRCYFFPDGPSIEVCLPVGDMINHAPAQNASVEVQYHETSKMMCFQTTRQIAAGEEHLGDECWWRKTDFSVNAAACIACIDLSWLSYDLIISRFAGILNLLGSCAFWKAILLLVLNSNRDTLKK